MVILWLRFCQSASFHIPMWGWLVALKSDFHCGRQIYLSPQSPLWLVFLHVGLVFARRILGPNSTGSQFYKIKMWENHHGKGGGVTSGSWSQRFQASMPYWALVTELKLRLNPQAQSGVRWCSRWNSVVAWLCHYLWLHFIVSLTFQEILCMNSYPLINNYLYKVVGDSFCDL